MTKVLKYDILITESTKNVMEVDSDKGGWVSQSEYASASRG